MRKCDISLFKEIVEFIKSIYKRDYISLHEPVFMGNEKKYVVDCIETTYVSSIGKYVDVLEEKLSKFVGSNYAIATVNGTSALHIALLLVGVKPEDEVITQPLTFVATCNAISYCGAKPVFVDVDLDTLGMSPESLENFLKNNCVVKRGKCINKTTGRVIRACVPMHTFGHPCRIDKIKEICEEWGIALVEDAAEALGSFYKGKHTGTFGKLGIFSFNGNKIITGGGGGAIVTDDEVLARKAKHLTTTARITHSYEYIHDEIGYNYRLPNINAALLVGQIEQLPTILTNKRNLAKIYEERFKAMGVRFIKEPEGAVSNYWLNGIILENKEQRNMFLEYATNNGVMCRPVWRLMNNLPMYKDCQSADLSDALYLEERVVNIPSTPIINHV